MRRCRAAAAAETVPFSGTFAEGTSLAVGENGNAIIEVGSDGSTGYFIDYVQCTTADCSTYSDRQVPGTWTNLGLLSLNLGPDGLGRMIAQTDSGTVGHIRPKVPTSLQVLSSPVIPLVSVPGCLPTDYGIAIGTTYQAQDQDGNALKSGSMEPQEKLLNLVLNGSEPINPIPNWVDIWNKTWPGSTKFTNADGQFLDAPFAVCTSDAFRETVTQPISMLMNKVNYTVRTNNWVTVSPTRGTWQRH